MKRILITGANKGIGFATVKKLLESFNDTFILLGSRDLTRGKQALESLLKSYLPLKIWKIKTLILKIFLKKKG